MLDNSKNLHKRRYLKSHNIKNNIEYEFQAKFYTINIMTKFTVFTAGITIYNIPTVPCEKTCRNRDHWVG